LRASVSIAASFVAGNGVPGEVASPPVRKAFVMEFVYNGESGMAGGPSFGAGVAALAAEKRLTSEGLAAACGLDAERTARILSGDERVTVAVLARLARALRVRPIEFMQKTGLLSLEVYAMGLDPLFFLPEGPIRYDARIYMREINPRHAVPEGDMTKRNPVLKAVAEDPLLDPLGKLEVEFTYLLRTAIALTGGRL
jgi:transcriptional regulator with XRE-family HTH domain